MRKVWKVILTACTIICLLGFGFILCNISFDLMKALKTINYDSSRNIVFPLLSYTVFFVFCVIVLVSLWIVAFNNSQKVQSIKANAEIVKERIKKKIEFKRRERCNKKINKFETKLNKLKSDK